YHTANKLVRTNDEGQLTVYTSSVTEDSSVANKNYVDIEVGKKANTSHTHSQSDITGLSTALSGKADKSHTHTTSQLTDYPGHMPNYGWTSYGKIPVRESDSDNIRVGDAPAKQYHVTNRKYVDSRPALFSGAGAPPTSIAGAVAGDFWLDTDTMELHKITGV